MLKENRRKDFLNHYSREKAIAGDEFNSLDNPINVGKVDFKRRTGIIHHPSNKKQDASLTRFHIPLNNRDDAD